MTDIIVGQVWTRTYSDWIELLIVMGITARGWARVLKVSEHDRFINIRHTTIKPNTITGFYQRTDLEFLIRYGSPREYLKKLMRDRIRVYKKDINYMRQDMRKLKETIKEVKRLDV